MVSKGASVRDGCVETGDLEVGVGGWGAVPLHRNQPGSWYLSKKMNLLQVVQKAMQYC